MFPHIGYIEDVELQDRNKRRKYGLKPIERAKPPTDMQARMDNAISRESDWINLDTTVSTSADQIALAPGYLQREWTQNGRRYFHYKTTAPILGFWSYLSARYQVKKDTWKAADGTTIPIEIYYDAKHPYNVDRMIDGVKKSLDYFTKNFSPYQHKQVRILEFPGYARSRSRSRTPSPSPSRSASSPTCATRTRSTTSSTSPRTRSRTSGGRTRSSAATCRAGRCSSRRWPSTPRSWSWRRSTAARRCRSSSSTSSTATCATAAAS
jgi:hypothetical protein